MQNPNTEWLYLWQYLQRDTVVGVALEYPNHAALLVTEGAYHGKSYMDDLIEVDWYMNEVFPDSRRLLLATQERTLLRIQ